MKGLKKDHQRLADFLFTHLHTMHEHLALLLDSLSTLYPEHTCEFATLLTTLSSISVTEKYLLARSSPDSSLYVHIAQLEAEILPMHTHALSLLSLLPSHSHYHELHTLCNMVTSITTKYLAFLKHCDYTTQFHESPYSGADVMVVGFDNYDDEYDQLLESLYELGGSLDDWVESMVKSPFHSTEDAFDYEEEDMFTLDADVATYRVQSPNWGINVC